MAHRELTSRKTGHLEFRPNPNFELVKYAVAGNTESSRSSFVFLHSVIETTSIRSI
jgi:hypothetical protein